MVQCVHVPAWELAALIVPFLSGTMRDNLGYKSVYTHTPLPIVTLCVALSSPVHMHSHRHTVA